MEEKNKAVAIIKKAQEDLSSGKISRREFNSIMMAFGAIAGYTLFGSFAEAWTGTRMRKSSGISGYQISRSLRLRANANAYLTRTPASAGNRQTFTWSGWIKRGTLALQNILQAGANPGGTVLYFGSDHCLHLTLYISAAETFITNQVFRDPGAWYHLVLAVDTTQATSSNRVKIYVNGLQVTSFSTLNYPAQNTSVTINSTTAHTFGLSTSEVSGYLDGYQAEINFIDGQALTPTSFGQTDITTGAWAVKKYVGTYGTNGFYLPFSDTSSTTNLVKDSSGTGNHWTPNNISLTAGITYDSMTDVPLTYGTTDRGNYCTLNPLFYDAPLTLAAGNLSSSTTTFGNWSGASGTMSVSSGQWYWETTAASAVNPGSEDLTAGIQLCNSPMPTSVGGYAVGSYAYITSGSKINNSTTTGYGATWTNGDIIGVALDLNAGTLTFYKNGVSQGVAFSGLSGVFTPAVHHSSYSVAATNFGQRPFSYTVPSGFKKLHTGNLSTPTIVKSNQYFDINTYTGNGASQSIVNSGSMQPNFVWAKGRDVTYSHGLFDSVRGAPLKISSNLTSSEVSSAGVSSFNSNGFSLGSDAGLNQNSSSYVAWQWKAGGAAASNTSGTITSQVSANTTSGFSIVTWTGEGSSSAKTVGHGLGVAPSFIIAKNRTTATQESQWTAYHKVLGAGNFLRLNTTEASISGSNRWGGVTPTSSVFTVGGDSAAVLHESGVDYIAYCFSEVEGFSKFGSYTGNASADGPFIFCGFKPRYVMIKLSSGASNEDWLIHDSARNTYNNMSQRIYASLSNAEDASGLIDFVSTGFKIRMASATSNQASGYTYIFAAFAETPFKYAGAR